MTTITTPGDGLVVEHPGGPWRWGMNLAGTKVYGPVGPERNVAFSYDPDDGELRIAMTLWHAGGTRVEAARIPARDLAAFIALCEARRHEELRSEVGDLCREIEVLRKRLNEAGIAP